MIELLQSLKQDLLGRRLLPVFALAAVALVGAVAYTVLGGGGSSSQIPAASISNSLPPVPPTIAAPAPANPNQAVSETTSGAHYQRGGTTRDPFVPLPEPAKTVTASAPAAGGANASAGASGSGSPAGSSGGSAGSGTSGGSTTTGNPTPNPTPSKPKPKPLYKVALLFGLAPPPAQNPQLTPYADLSRITPLPSHKEVLIAFAGVGPSGKGALFTLIQPAILKGKGICLPSASQCESLDMPVGQVEELSYIGPTGQPVVYQLQVVSIAKSDESAARIAALARAARTARAHAAISYGAHGAPSSHRRRVARPRAHLHR